jgi:hypothetical protein
MAKYTTKYFGEVELLLDEAPVWADFDTTYDGQDITVSFSDYGLYGDKIKLCWEIIDKYIEINEIAKKEIIECFNKNENIQYYFKCHFEDMLEEDELIEVFGVNNFDEINIKDVVEKMEYPNLLFGIKDGLINISVDYMVAKEYSDEILCVRMDEELNVTDFTHES